jgi:O-6-methylguanine DNA methyltransferase
MNDLETTLSGLRSEPPADLPDAVRLGTGLVDGATVRPSPVGDVVVAFNPTGVVSVDLASDETLDARHLERFGRHIVEARPPSAWGDRIDQALAEGRPGRLPLDLRSLTEFQRSVLSVAATIPRGEVRPYGWLAHEVGNDGAVRAVGSVMAKNPVPLVVPCHRVVRSDGTIGAYSLGGPENKRTLLTAEGADPGHLEGLARRGIRYVGSDTTGIFCLPTCRHARRITATHRMEFRARGDAEVAGLRPCSVCRP